MSLVVKQRAVAPIARAFLPVFGGKTGVAQVGKPRDLAAASPRTRLPALAPFAQNGIFAKQIIGYINAVIAGIPAAIAQQMETNHFCPPAWFMPRTIPDYTLCDRVNLQIQGDSMQRRAMILAGLAALAALGAYGIWRKRQPRPMDLAAFQALYRQPLAAPTGDLRVYHLGHSLVGRDMPVILDQLAQAAGHAGHAHASQLGWGASLDQHRKGAAAVPGFAEENAHGKHRPADAALASGDYDAVVLTEMVEIKDAIRYHNSGAALAHWARAARGGNPNARVYLYETWHRLDDAEGWLPRIDADLTRAWQDQLLRVAMAEPDVGTIYIIPGGQVMAAAVRAMEGGHIPGLSRREDLFSRDAAGAVDPIHLNDLGAYIIALTHFAMLYHRSPVGLPHRMRLANGQEASPVPDLAVEPLQRLVWDVVSGYGLTGIAG